MIIYYWDPNIHWDILCWFKAFFCYLLLVFPQRQKWNYVKGFFFSFRPVIYLCYTSFYWYFFHIVSTFQVHWFQQQHERVRKKRDYAADLYSYQQKYGLLRSIAPSSRIQYRQVGEPLFFPDPFFKEQWYLVST